MKTTELFVEQTLTGFMIYQEFLRDFRKWAPKKEK